ncbi:MAG: YdjY domain-containing protein [Planctomycetota bacterium]
MSHRDRPESPAGPSFPATRVTVGALAVAAFLTVGARVGVGQESGERAGPPAPGAASEEDAAEALAAAFGAAGILVDRDAGALALPVRVEILNELLEYLLVGPLGAAHESLFVTDVDPSVLQTAILTLGVEPGTNVDYVPLDPPPTREEVRAGARTHEVVLPRGGEVFLYAVWRESAGPKDVETGAFPAETLHFHRVEDLVLDLVRGRTMRRHPWVWIGSRMIPGRRPDDPDQFAATATSNLLNIAFFSMGDTLATAALPECTSQTSWRPNVWMLPDKGTEVMLVIARQRLGEVPEAFSDGIPFAPEPVEETESASDAQR